MSPSPYANNKAQTRRLTLRVKGKRKELLYTCLVKGGVGGGAIQSAKVSYNFASRKLAGMFPCVAGLIVAIPADLEQVALSVSGHAMIHDMVDDMHLRCAGGFRRRRWCAGRCRNCVGGWQVRSRHCPRHRSSEPPVVNGGRRCGWVRRIRKFDKSTAVELRDTR